MIRKVSRPSDMQTGATRPPAHQVIYRALRELVLFGDIVPGEPVTIQGLTERLGAGMTPVREAIRRLTAEGALEFQGNRRVIVPVLTADHIAELIVARAWIDPQMMMRAANRMTARDKKNLANVEKALDEAIQDGDIRRYLEHNYHFHTRIYGLADAPILAELAEGLWLRFGPSLRVVCSRMGTEKLPDRHKEIIEALRDNRPQAAADAIGEDVDEGLEQVRHALLAGQT